MKKKLEKNKKVKSKRSFSWTSPKVEVRETVNRGRGIFSKEKIEKGEVVSIFGGYIKTIEEEQKLPKKFNDNGVQINHDFVITVIKEAELEDASYFNHSCNPNVGFNGQIMLVAMKEILPNQEVCFDYAMAISDYKTNLKYKFKCHCGSEKCRKIITNMDWKDKKIQKKYQGYFQDYLQRLIDSHK